MLKKLLLFAPLLFFSVSLFATPKTNSVNVLTWWGYLDMVPQDVQQIEKKCNAHISYDTYYSNDEFLDRFEKNASHYDAIIFSETILNAVKDSIASSNSNLYLVADKYQPTIKKEYLQLKLPHNIAFFILSLTGFLYNPSVINISPTESVDEIFQDAQKNIVVMIDDPVEANFLTDLMSANHDASLSMSHAEQFSLTWKNFKKIFQNTHVIITNSPEQIIKLPNFAFAFQWSGDAIGMLEKNNKKLKFLVHPKLSYISADLIAQLNNRQATQCVVTELASKKFIDDIQEKTFYFSPYFPGPGESNSTYRDLYMQTQHSLGTLPWLLPPPKEDLEKLKRSWDYIRLKSSQAAN